MSHKHPQPGKIGIKLWAIFDRAEDNSVSQRRNENGEVAAFRNDAPRVVESLEQWPRVQRRRS